MKWQKKIHDSLVEHQFKGAGKEGSPKGQSPRQMTTAGLKTTLMRDISAEQKLRKAGKNTSPIQKRISGFVDEFKKTRSKSS
tara:strand:+ start:217 stop:462 length:246 start_codon:yes stop_codon:yes gene_type:complete